MNHNNEFHAEVAQRWESAFNELGLDGQNSKSWVGSAQIQSKLAHLIMKSTNHAHYPTGGGQDWESISITQERDCLAISISDRSVDVFRPIKMTAEYFPESPQESFVLIELDHLDADQCQKPFEGLSQELVELPNDGYVNRVIWDQGFTGYDAYGHEIPIPEDARLVSRWLGGKILLVAKGSIWNGTSATYDGCHNDMTSEQIREIITRSMSDS